MSVYQYIEESRKNGKKLFALLIDPDKQSNEELLDILNKAKAAKVDLFFVGGSLLTNDSLSNCIQLLKEKTNIPVVLFPGTQCKFATMQMLFFSYLLFQEGILKC